MGGCLGERCHLEKAGSAKNNQVERKLILCCICALYYVAHLTNNGEDKCAGSVEEVVIIGESSVWTNPMVLQYEDGPRMVPLG